MTNNNQQLTNIFSELLQSVWKNLEDVIGSSATALIFQSALHETTLTYPFLEKVQVLENGVEFPIYNEEVSDIQWATLRTGFVALIDSIFSILTDLTGGILVDSLSQAVAVFSQEADQLAS